MLLLIKNDYHTHLRSSSVNILDTRLLGNEENIPGNHLPGISQCMSHICLLGNDKCSDIWRMSKFVHRWRHSDRIRVLQCICCNLNDQMALIREEKTNIYQIILLPHIYLINILEITINFFTYSSQRALMKH